jgi:hypothetical protein
MVLGLGLLGDARKYEVFHTLSPRELYGRFGQSSLACGCLSFSN